MTDLTDEQIAELERLYQALPALLAEVKRRRAEAAQPDGEYPGPMPPVNLRTVPVTVNRKCIAPPWLPPED